VTSVTHYTRTKIYPKIQKEKNYHLKSTLGIGKKNPKKSLFKMKFLAPKIFWTTKIFSPHEN